MAYINFMTQDTLRFLVQASLDDYTRHEMHHVPLYVYSPLKLDWQEVVWRFAVSGYGESSILSKALYYHCSMTRLFSFVRAKVDQTRTT